MDVHYYLILEVALPILLPISERGREGGREGGKEGDISACSFLLSLFPHLSFASSTILVFQTSLKVNLLFFRLLKSIPDQTIQHLPVDHGREWMLPPSRARAAV